MLIYGHRGAAGEAPENTLPGFLCALAAGVRRVELDLHLSRDGELVVIHDASLRRTTGKRGRVAEFSAAELAVLDARRGGPGWPERVGVPALGDVLAVCPAMEHFQLECKPASAAERVRVAMRLSRLFREHSLYRRATVTSFDAALLRQVGVTDPRIALGLITDRSRPDPVATALALGAGLLALDHRLCSKARIRAAQAAGLEVSAWTVNSLPRARELRERGIDSLITDYPSRLAAPGAV
jgi:glycerophosphoryl diester phosphodiesterase